jgi:hypothetical protein
MVNLNVPINTRQKLTPEEKQLRANQIRAAQDIVLDELARSPHKVHRRFDFVPLYP